MKLPNVFLYNQQSISFWLGFYYLNRSKNFKNWKTDSMNPEQRVHEILTLRVSTLTFPTS